MSAGPFRDASLSAVVSPLSLDLFAVARAGDHQPRHQSGELALSGRVVARAAARRQPDLRVAALLALLPFDRGSEQLGAALGEAGLLDAVEAMARLEAHLAGCRQRVLAALDALPPETPPAGIESPMASDSQGWAALTRSHRASSVATRCGMSPYLGSLALRRSATLVPGGLFDAVGAAMESGALSPAKAELIADELMDLDDPLLARDIVAAVLPTARTLGVGRLRDAIRAEVACAREAETCAAHEGAVGLREVSRPQEVGAGLASLTVIGPSSEIAHLWALTDRAARAAAPHAPDESIRSLRFDALIALICRGSASPETSAPTRVAGIAPASSRSSGRESDSWPGPERGAAINVVVGIGTLLGADDQPAELNGLGLIDARTARQLAADPTGTWRRLLVDDDGRLVSRSRAYRPPPTMAALILARDRTCRFPGCRRTRLDIDHIIEHDRGGPTEPSNLAGLCRTHHNLKTHGLWDYRIDPETGDAHWADRHGHAAIQPANRYRLPRHRGIELAMDRARARRASVMKARAGRYVSRATSAGHAPVLPDEDAHVHAPSGPSSAGPRAQELNDDPPF